MLDEVTVFADRAVAATKTDTKLVEIPQSISVITAEQISERGVQNYQETFRYSAGVDTDRYGIDSRGDFFSARGFELRQYLDGLNKQPDFLYGSRTEVFTLERAEVLRGPSAVLYGAGTSGGLLNAVSKRPQFGFGAELGLQLGTDERKQVQGDITGELSDSLAGRFVGVWRDAQLQPEGQANDKRVVMPSITWRPTAQTDVTLIALYQEERMGTHTYLPLSKTINANADNPRVPIDLFIGEPGFSRMDTDHAAFTLLANHRFNDLFAVSSSVRHIDQEVEFREIYGSYFGGAGVDPFIDPERTLLAREFYVLDEDYSLVNADTRVQFDFQTGPLRHKVLVGVDYTLFKQDRQEGFSCRGVTDGSFDCYIGGSPPPLNVYDPVYGQSVDFGFTNAYQTRSTQLGFYLQDQVKWGERVSLVLGARRDEASSEVAASPKDETSATTFKVGVIAELMWGLAPFASYSESFAPIFGGDYFGNPFDPQEGRQYEAGIKWQPFENALLTVTYFDIEDSNFLTQDPDNIQNFIQSGSIGSTGIEFEAVLNFPQGIELLASYSYNKAEVTEGSLTHQKGARIEDLPEHLASLWTSKTFLVNDALSWRIGAGVRRVGDKIDSFQLQRTPPVTLVDAMAEASYGPWNVALNVNNVADKEFCTTAVAWSYPYGVCYPGMNRTILGTMTRKF